MFELFAFGGGFEAADLQLLPYSGARIEVEFNNKSFDTEPSQWQIQSLLEVVADVPLVLLVGGIRSHASFCCIRQAQVFERARALLRRYSKAPVRIIIESDDVEDDIRQEFMHIFGCPPFGSLHLDQRLSSRQGCIGQILTSPSRGSSRR